MRRLCLISTLLFVGSAVVWAQAPQPPPISDPSDLVATFQGLVGQWSGVVSSYAMELFWALAALDIAWFGIELWRTYNGDIQQAVLSTAFKLLTIGMFLALLLNAGTWINDIISAFVQVGKDASGLPGLGPSILLLQGFKIFGALLGTAMVTGALFDPLTSLALIVAALIICLSFLAICFQFVVTQIQASICLGLGFLFLGFGGSRWTAPYVERYFALAVATGVKLMVLYALAGGAWSLTQQWITKAAQAPFNPSGVETAWLIMCGAVLYAGICWYASSIVSAMMGGSPNLTHSDFISFVAPVVSAGVSAGLIAAGLATGGTSAVAGAGVAAAGAGSSGASAGAGAAGAAAAVAPSGVTPPQPAAAAVSAAGSLAQAGVGAASRMPHGGSHSTPPSFNGFNH